MANVRGAHAAAAIARSWRAVQNPAVDSLMTQLRKARGLSLEAVARKVNTDQANLSRVEKGAQLPKRELARALFRFYDGRLPIGAIYDPAFYEPPACGG